MVLNILSIYSESNNFDVYILLIYEYYDNILKGCCIVVLLLFNR